MFAQSTLTRTEAIQSTAFSATYIEYFILYINNTFVGVVRTGLLFSITFVENIAIDTSMKPFYFLRFTNTFGKGVNFKTITFPCKYKFLHFETSQMKPMFST